MKKSVLFVTSLFPSEADPYRATFNVSIVRSLLERLDGVVLAPERYLPFVEWIRRRSPAQDAGSSPMKDGLKGIRVVRPVLLLPPLVGRSLHWVLYFLCIYHAAVGLMRKTDFSCIYSMYAYPDGAASVLLGLVRKKRTIVHAMGCDINLTTKYRMRRAVIRWSLKKATHVISVSQDMKRTLIGLGIPPEKISVVYNGVDRTLFRPMPQKQCRKQLGTDPAEKNILFVGSLEEVKGVETLLASFDMLLGHGPQQAPYKLYMIGSGSLLHRLQQMIRIMGLEDSVFLLGNRSSQEVALWMNACDLFCLPSIREGLPNVILEALSCSRPIVATKVGGIPELLQNYQPAEMVAPHDVHSLFEGLRAGLARPSSTEYGAGSGIAAHHLTWESFSQEVYRIIGSMEGA